MLPVPRAEATAEVAGFSRNYRKKAINFIAICRDMTAVATPLMWCAVTFPGGFQCVSIVRKYSQP
jgi:hypothetical protein